MATEAIRLLCAKNSLTRNTGQIKQKPRKSCYSLHETKKAHCFPFRSFLFKQTKTYLDRWMVNGIAMGYIA